MDGLDWWFSMMMTLWITKGAFGTVLQGYGRNPPAIWMFAELQKIGAFLRQHRAVHSNVIEYNFALAQKYVYIVLAFDWDRSVLIVQRHTIPQDRQNNVSVPTRHLRVRFSGTLPIGSRIDKTTFVTQEWLCCANVRICKPAPMCSKK